MRHFNALPSLQRQGERILTDDTNRREFHLDASSRVMRIAQQQVLVCDIVVSDTNLVRQLRQNPDPLAPPERPRSVIDSSPLAYDGIEKWALSRNSTRPAIYAAFLKATNSVRVAAIRCALSSR